MKKNVILCVDDEKIILDSIKAQLKEEYGSSFLYETAESASEAFEIIEEIMTDKNASLIIISDWQMPVIRGDEFLANVHHKYPKAITILLTGQADDTSIERSKKEANLLKCIRKPRSKDELFATIDLGLATTY